MQLIIRICRQAVVCPFIRLPSCPHSFYHLYISVVIYLMTICIFLASGFNKLDLHQWKHCTDVARSVICPKFDEIDGWNVIEISDWLAKWPLWSWKWFFVVFSLGLAVMVNIQECKKSCLWICWEQVPVTECTTWQQKLYFFSWKTKTAAPKLLKRQKQDGNGKVKKS